MKPPPGFAACTGRRYLTVSQAWAAIQHRATAIGWGVRSWPRWCSACRGFHVVKEKR